MLEYLINGANILCLAGCVYVAYLTLRASRARVRASRQGQKNLHGPASHELLFRNPCADYYI